MQLDIIGKRRGLYRIFERLFDPYDCEVGDFSSERKIDYVMDKIKDHICSIDLYNLPTYLEKIEPLYYKYQKEWDALYHVEYCLDKETTEIITNRNDEQEKYIRRVNWHRQAYVEGKPYG